MLKNKKGLFSLILFVVGFIVVIGIIVGIIYIKGNQTLENQVNQSQDNSESINQSQINNCAKEGEMYSFAMEEYPDKCCEGLVETGNQDAVSIAGKCYITGRESGFPGGKCLSCGDGNCGKYEDSCSCAEDCTGVVENSRYKTVQGFCSDWADTLKEHCDYINEVFAGEENICKLCGIKKGNLNNNQNSQENNSQENNTQNNVSNISVMNTTCSDSECTFTEEGEQMILSGGEIIKLDSVGFSLQYYPAIFYLNGSDDYIRLNMGTSNRLGDYRIKYTDNLIYSPDGVVTLKFLTINYKKIKDCNETTCVFYNSNWNTSGENFYENGNNQMILSTGDVITLQDMYSNKIQILINGDSQLVSQGITRSIGGYRINFTDHAYSSENSPEWGPIAPLSVNYFKQE